MTPTYPIWSFCVAFLAAHSEVTTGGVAEQRAQETAFDWIRASPGEAQWSRACRFRIPP